MPAQHPSINERLDLESRVLAAALKQSVDRDDKNGIVLAYKELSNLLKQRQATLDKQSEKASKKDKKTATETKRYQAPDIYELIGDTPLSSFAEIHTHFLVNVREILHNNIDDPQSSKQLHEKLRQLWIAHDILHTPATRTDYDLRRLGIRDNNQTSPESQNQKLPSQAELSVSELVRCIKSVESSGSSAEINTTESASTFGNFDQGVLTNEELETLRLGQRWIQEGKISIEQFISSMITTHSGSPSFTQYLLNNNWITQSDIANKTETDKQTALVPIYKMPTNLAPIQSNRIDICKAAPSWANQLVWDEEIPATQPIVDDKLTEPSVSNVSNKSSRKKRKHKSKF